VCVGAQPMSWDNFGEMRLTIHIYVCGMAPPFSGVQTPACRNGLGRREQGSRRVMDDATRIIVKKQSTHLRALPITRGSARSS
jgi:hypothetical protein